ESSGVGSAFSCRSPFTAIDESSLGGMEAGGSDSKAPLLRRAPDSPPPGLLAAYSKPRSVASPFRGSDAISGTKPTGYAQDVAVCSLWRCGFNLIVALLLSHKVLFVRWAQR